jgi:hypothetical protein
MLYDKVWINFEYVEVKLLLLQVKLSVVTSSKLPTQLQSVKRKLGLTLIRFEDASVDLKPFVKNHSFESSKFFLHSILKHYKDVSRLTVSTCFSFLTHWHEGIEIAVPNLLDVEFPLGI